MRGRTPHPVVEVTKVIGPQLRSPYVAVAKSPLGRTTEPPLDILSISVWSPSAQSAELPSGFSEGEGRKHLGHERDEDLLLVHEELATGALAYILRDSDLRRTDSMSVGDALLSLLHGAVVVYPDAFTCPSYR